MALKKGKEKNKVRVGGWVTKGCSIGPLNFLEVTLAKELAAMVVGGTTGDT